jgi:riboflavin kinase / FMN adenylyltransferase
MNRVVVIGNFDGVHRGHQSLLLAARRYGRPVVLTFDPHPSAVLGRPVPPMLTTLAYKRELLNAHGVDEVVVQRFTVDFAELSPESFAREVLVDALRAQHVLVGADFRFGKGRRGGLIELRDFGKTLGFQADAFELLAHDGPLISSTRIRALVRAGELQQAASLLGRPHVLSGTVIHGAERGRTLGFPTANLGTPPEALAPNGVYGVRAEVKREEQWQPLGDGIMNLGTRPTVAQDPKPTAEVYLFEPPGDLYGAALRIQVVQHIRAERKFESVEALRNQISTDVEQAKRAMLEHAPDVRTPSHGNPS